MIHDESELHDRLTTPRPVLVDFMPSVASPLVILGAGGKMGPTLAVLAKRAAELAGHRLEVIAVSRFSDGSTRGWLEAHGVTTQGADLLRRDAMRQLPDAEDVIYLVGLKFGTRDNPARTWAANTLVPAHVAERYAGSRVVALSTGNVYPQVAAPGGAAKEASALTPLGEYANAAVARERLFEYFAQSIGIRVALIRLSYAVEMRYGVLADLARKVHSGESIDVTNGWLNWIWQGDANELIIRALRLASNPPAAFNLTGPYALSVRAVAMKFSEMLDRPAHLAGTESETALLSNPEKLYRELGPPPTDLDTIIGWTAHWVKHGGRYLNKPTHFEVRDGAY